MIQVFLLQKHEDLAMRNGGYVEFDVEDIKIRLGYDKELRAHRLDSRVPLKRGPQNHPRRSSWNAGKTLKRDKTCPHCGEPMTGQGLAKHEPGCQKRKAAVNA